MNEPLTKKQRYEKLRAKLKNERASWEPYWRDLADFIQPDKAMFLVSDRNRGDRRNQKIIDSTATFSSRVLGAGMHSNITSPARKWFHLTTPDPELAEVGAVKQWLDDVERVLLSIFEKSNLYQVLPTLYEDEGVFGTGVMSVMEDDEDVIRCYDYPIGSYYLATDSKRRVRVFVHEYSLTVRQLVESYAQPGKNGKPDMSIFSRSVQNLYERGDLEEWVDVVQVIEPNAAYDPQKLPAKFKAFTSCVYEAGTDEKDKVLSESGYDEFPILAVRWNVRGNDVYGRNSPGMLSIGDVKQLQTMEKRGAQALEKMVNPPLLADPSMQNSPLSMLPGNVSYGRTNSSQPAAQPLHSTDVRLDFLEAKGEQIRTRVRRAFYEDLFLMLAALDDKERTATEIHERKEEKLIALGPVVGRHDQDLHNPLIDRVFAIANRRGMIPEAPEELQGMPLRVEFESIMHQALKANGVGNIERSTSYVLNIVQTTGDTSALDKFNIDEAIEEHGTALSVPPKLIRGQDEVNEIRQGRAQQQQAMEQAATLKDMASGAKTLSETNVTSPNALTELLGGGAAAA